MKVSRFLGTDQGPVRSIRMIKPNGGPKGGRVIYRSSEGSADGIRAQMIKPGVGTVQKLQFVTEGNRGGTSDLLRPLERSVRKLVVREAEIAQTYLALHKRSSERKRNGWMKDMPRNILRAVKSDD